MNDKSSSKKIGKSIKEKRADKADKKAKGTAAANAMESLTVKKKR